MGMMLKCEGYKLIQSKASTVRRKSYKTSYDNLFTKHLTDEVIIAIMSQNDDPKKF
jgi:hypothetical protein